MARKHLTTFHDNNNAKSYVQSLSSVSPCYLDTFMTDLDEVSHDVVVWGIQGTPAQLEMSKSSNTFS